MQAAGVQTGPKHVCCIFPNNNYKTGNTFIKSSHCQVSSSFFLLTSCENEWECRRQPSHFWASSWELEMSTWVATYYLDEDHPRWSLFRGSGATWSQRTGSESTSLEIDVFVEHNTLVVVHAIIGLDSGQHFWYSPWSAIPRIARSVGGYICRWMWLGHVH